MNAAVPELTLHVVPQSHPCMTVIAALDLKGLEYERVDLTLGAHPPEVEKIYGEGNVTVPSMMAGDEKLTSSHQIMAWAEEAVPEPPLYPADKADAVREAEKWADENLQRAGRRLIWGAMHFRPETMGTFGGAAELDAAGTDFAIKMLRRTWKYLDITAELLARDLEQLPAHLDRVDELVAEGVIGGPEPNAADLQIASSLRIMLTIGDVEVHMRDRPAEELARRLFPEYPGSIPAGAFPASWGSPTPAD